MRTLPPAIALLTALTAGCGGNAHSPASTANDGPLPPGKVERAAKSNSHKEIPTRFSRAVSLAYRSTVLLVTPIRVATLPRDRVGVVVGVRNIGHVAWNGAPAALSRLAISHRDSAPERVIAGDGASPG